MKQIYYQHIALLCLLIATTWLLSACSNDDSKEVKETAQAPSEIIFNPNIWKMAEGTRTTTIDNNTALQDQDLKIDAYYHDTETKYLDGAKLHYDSSWKFWDGSQVHYYWPIEGSQTSPDITVGSLDFVGVCPYANPGYVTTTSYAHSTGITFTCDMSSYMTLASQASISEYLVAVLDAQTYTTQAAAPGGALPLQFKHPFALIKFVITAASGTNVKINSVSIPALNTTAACTYNGTTLSWSSQSGSAAMTLTQELKNGGTTEGTPFMVIPNDYGTKTLTVNATWDDWSNVTTDVTADVAFNWQAGYIYTYNLTLSKYALKVDVAKFTEQW